MRNPNLCRPLLEEILKIKIKNITYIDYEKTLNIAVEQKGIRMDIYVEDEKNSVYNLEMQVHNEGDLPFRTRYYQGIIDLNLLKKGDIEIIKAFKNGESINDISVKYDVSVDEVKEIANLIDK